MARKTIVRLDSDLDGSPADETVSFGLGRDSYEIDLSADQAAELRSLLAPYVAAARRSNSARRRGAAEGSVDDIAQVRAWARENGYEVGDRGRVPARVREAYRNR